MEFALFAFLTFTSLFSSLASLRHEGSCLVPVDEGPCKGNVERYYYSTLTQKCEVFTYGGCRGNANNFNSYQECRKTCFRIPKIPQNCRFPKEEGHCRGLFPRYFFNITTMRCESFSYGGCGGNANRFQDRTSCRNHCIPKTDIPVMCLDPLDKGTCSASITRYYYNAATKKCEEFVYSGCGGGVNNFESQESCVKVCVQGVKKRKGHGKLRRLKKNRNNGTPLLQA
ncbi:hypothetical protein ILYODFUR_028450 [Ilyodon furcidens]|uniref:Tissue factor pathway inhibitor n=1 Tax=Ilyodon furcidens TaxID=33524 RepID=A0ABV0TBT0_9TELE